MVGAPLSSDPEWRPLARYVMGLLKFKFRLAPASARNPGCSLTEPTISVGEGP